jgi:hypothetical protein
MKLSDVFVAQAAMGRLGTLKMAPKTAYVVLKFAQKFDAEYAIVEKQRSALIRKIACVKDGEPAHLEQGSPGCAEFVAQFGEVLDVDSGLAVCPLKMDALLDAIEDVEGNTLSVQDIAMLEVLFESDAA